MTITPYRLWLTVTYERADDQLHVVDELIGPVVYQAAVDEGTCIVARQEPHRLERKSARNGRSRTTRRAAVAGGAGPDGPRPGPIRGIKYRGEEIINLWAHRSGYDERL